MTSRLVSTDLRRMASAGAAVVVLADNLVLNDIFDILTCIGITACQLSLSFARYSIILMLAGTFVIGFAQSVPVLVAGLIINTLGVATDLSLMGFASGLPIEDIAGRCFSLIASLESFGTMLGIGVLYPVYQLHVDDSTTAGGTPYYICGALYPLVTIVIWRI